MKIKVIVMALLPSPRINQAIRWVLLPLAVLAGSVGVARAWTADTSWVASGQPLKAAGLMALLNEADGRMKALEAQKTYYVEQTADQRIDATAAVPTVDVPGVLLTVNTSANAILDITATGGFEGNGVGGATWGTCFASVVVDGKASNDVIAAVGTAGVGQFFPFTLLRRITVPAAGTHTIKIQAGRGGAGGADCMLRGSANETVRLRVTVSY